MVDPPYRMKNMMPGMIMLWYGSRATIPSGWHECDGTMGTPDLRDLFVRGTAIGLTPGDLTGNWSHTHEFTGDGHDHDVLEGTGLAAGTDFYPETSVDPATGETDSSPLAPRSMYLCYIMKL